MKDRLTRSILGTMVISIACQVLIFLTFALARGFFARYAALFFGVSISFHLLLCVLLLFFRGDFVLESTGVALDHINLANRITLFRVTTLPTLLVLIMAAREYRIRIPLLALIVLVFISDFADGYVSRKHAQVTKVGRMMDSASDYSLLVVLSIVFYYFRLLPLWFFLLVIGRLFLQSAFMGVLIAVKRHIEPKTTPMGKVAVASIMVLYAVEVGRLVFALPMSWPFAAVEWVAGGIVAASIVDKVISFIRELGTTVPAEGTGTGTV